jgi:hypothetical protein
MRRQHQMVAFAAPGNMIAKPASVCRFTLFPLDWDVFIESGHSLASADAFYSTSLLGDLKYLDLSPVKAQ